jgi:hypothetical protein
VSAPGAAASAGLVVRFGRLEQRGLLLGVSGPRLACLGVALVVFVAAEVLGGAPAVAASAPVWLTAASLGGVVTGGRPLLEWVPLLTSWGWRQARSGTLHRHRLTPAHGRGELLLPDRVPRRVLPTTAGTAAVWDRRSRLVTVVALVHPQSFLLAEASEQDARAMAWGRLLAGLCRRDDVVRVQVLHRVGPGGGTAVRRWWADHAAPDASGWAARVLADAVADCAERADRHETLIAFALKASRNPRNTTTTAEQAVEALTETLHAADIPVARWLSPRELRRVVRLAYDPDTAPVDEAATRRPESGAGSVVGPMALEESWDRVRTETSWQAVFWMAQWPRTPSRVDFLAAVLAAPGVHRSVSLVIEPVPTGRALRDVRRARVGHAADAAQRARIGRLEEESITAEVDDVTRRELDLVAGHGDLRFTGFVTVTAPTSEELDGACAVVETTAAQAMCELRRLSGQQVAAHTVAAVPLAAPVFS